ncbi:type II secretion system protein GspJ, partial [Parathermosynechococcus lividus]
MQLEALQLGMAVLMQDFTQITNRPVRDAYGESRAALLVPDPLTGGVQLTRRGWPNPAEQPRGTLQRVFYRVDDGMLI